jgi:hypothetical protein
MGVHARSVHKRIAVYKQGWAIIILKCQRGHDNVHKHIAVYKQGWALVPRTVAAKAVVDRGEVVVTHVRVVQAELDRPRSPRQRWGDVPESADLPSFVASADIRAVPERRVRSNSIWFQKVLYVCARCDTALKSTNSEHNRYIATCQLTTQTDKFSRPIRPVQTFNGRTQPPHRLPVNWRII